MSNLDFDFIAVKAAGLVGAIVSTRLLQGTWPQKISAALCGAAISFYAAPYVSSRIGLPEGLGGFLIGVFGMAVASRIWEWIQTAPIVPLWQLIIDRLRKWLGL